MPPKAKSTAPPSDADVPVASSIRRKTRNTTKKGESSDVEAPPATISRKTRNQRKASSKAENSDKGEISRATSSTPYEENDSRTPRGTGSERSKTPAKEPLHEEEAREIHTMHSNALESPANETARPEEPGELPEVDFAFLETPGAPDPSRTTRNSLDEIIPVEPGSLTPTRGPSNPQSKLGIQPYSLTVPSMQDAGTQTASYVVPHPTASLYLHPMNDQCLNRRLNILNGRISISRLEIEEMEAEVAHIKEKYGTSVLEDKVN